MLHSLGAAKIIRVVGFQNSATSADLRFQGGAFVFVDQASKDWLAPDPLIAEIRGWMIVNGG